MCFEKINHVYNYVKSDEVAEEEAKNEDEPLEDEKKREAGKATISYFIKAV